jgi:hypothetical protein
VFWAIVEIPQRLMPRGETIVRSYGYLSQLADQRNRYRWRD